MLAGALLGVSAVCLLFMTGVVRGPGPRLQVDPEALYLPSELSGMRLLVEGRIRTDGDSSAYYLDLNGTIIRIDRPADQVQDGQPFKAVIQLLGNGMDFEVLDIYFFEDEKPESEMLTFIVAGSAGLHLAGRVAGKLAQEPIHVHLVDRTPDSARKFRTM
jgi:hypothetical protein